MQDLADLTQVKWGDFPVVAQLPTRPLAILFSRFTTQQEVLVFCGKIADANELVESEAELSASACYLLSAQIFYTPVRNVRDLDLLLNFYRRKQPFESPFPAAFLSPDGENVALFRFFEGDFYVLNFDSAKTRVSEPIKPLVPGFEPAPNFETAVAKFLLFDQVSNAAFYAPNRAGFQRCVYEGFAATDFKSCWCVHAVDIAEIIIEYVCFGGACRVAVVDLDYVAAGAKLLKYGITCSRQPIDQLEITYFEENESIPPEYAILLTRSIVQSASERTRVLFLNPPRFSRAALDFLLPGVPVSDPQRAFQSLEIGNLNNALSSSNLLGVHFRACAAQGNSIQNSLIFKYRPDLAQLARIRQLVDSDEAFSWLFGPNTELSHLDFVVLCQAAVSRLLQCIWLDGARVGSRHDLLSCIITTLLQYNIEEITIVVPECCYEPMSSLLKIEQYNDVAVFSQSNSPEKVLLLTEREVLALALAEPFQCAPLPRIVIIPFVCCRNIEVSVEKLYQNCGQLNPLFYGIVCEDSIEVSILEYMENCISSAREFQELEQKIAELQLLSYSDIMKALQSSGISGNLMQGQLDFSNTGIQGESKYLRLLDTVAFEMLNSHLEYELILQAALPFVFNTSKHFNLAILARIFGTEINGKVEINTSEGFKINNVHYGFYYETGDKRNQKSFYETAQMLDMDCLKPQNALMQMARERLQESSFSSQKDQVTENAVFPEAVLERFMQLAREHRPNEFQQSERRERENSKVYYVLPATQVPMGNFDYIEHVYRNAPLDTTITLCEKCAGEGKARYFARSCDICGATMDQIADDLSVFRPNSDKEAWRVDEYFARPDLQAPPADFVVNAMLSAVQPEGLHLEQPILIKNRRLTFAGDTDEILKIIAREDPALVRAALTIIDPDRCFAISGIVERYDRPETPLRCVIRTLIADSLTAFCGATIPGLYELPALPLSVVLRHAVPTSLFGISSYSDKPDERANYQGDIFGEFSRLLSSDIARLWKAYYAKLSVEEFCQRFDVGGYESFLEQTVLCCRKEKDFGFSPGPELLESPVFSTRCLANDNALILNCINGAVPPESHIMSQVAIYQHEYQEKGLSGPVLMRVLAFLLRTIQRSTFYTEIPPTAFAEALQERGADRVIGALERLEFPGFAIALKQSIADFFVPAEALPLVDKPAPGTKFPPPQRKFVQNHHEPRETSRTSAERSVDRSILTRSTPEMQLQSASAAATSQVSFTTQRSAPPTVAPPAIPQYEIPAIIPQLPMSQTAGRASGLISMHQIPTMYQTSPADARSPKYAQFQMGETPVVGLPARIPSGVVFQEPAFSMPQSQYQGDFFDRALLNGKDKVVFMIQRVINHYSCRANYYRRNLLYVPSVQEIPAKEAFPHLLGLQIANAQGLMEDKDFDTLLNILTNDFESQNQRKCENVHKFCTIFNEMAKEKLEIVSEEPELQLQFYDTKIFSTLYEWLVKRTLEAECDISHNSVVAFVEDPIFGIPMEELDQESASIREFAADAIFTMNREKIDNAFREAKSVCERYNEEDRNKQIMYLVKIGIGTGSTPLETFYRFIQKGEPLYIATLLSNLVRLLTICAAHKLEFPYKVPNVTETMEQVQQSIYRLEHMRFLHIKLEQFDFLQWLERLITFKGDQMHENEKDRIKDEMDASLCCNVTKINSRWADGLNGEEKRIVEWIGNVASEIDHFNKCLWSVDIAFSKYLTESDEQFNLLWNFKLERFSINDFDESQVKRAWEITLQERLLFMVLFGNSRSVLQELVTRGVLSSADLEFIDRIFRELQQQWSRLHDFILMHIITDMGYTEAMMHSIVGEDAKEKSKHVEFLRRGFFAAEESFQLDRTPMFIVYSRIVRETYGDRNDPLLPELPHLFACIGESKPLLLPSAGQIADAVEQLETMNSPIIEQQTISKDLLTRRVERLAHALRCERILTCDPLQKYLNDKAVQIVGQQVRHVQILTCERIEDLKRPVRRQPLSRPEEILEPPQMSQVAEPQEHRHSSETIAQPTPTQFGPTVQGRFVPAPPKTKPSQTVREDPGELTPVGQNSMLESTPNQKPAGTRPRHVQPLKSIEMLHPAARTVSNTKLSFYLEPPEVIQDFVLYIIQMSNAIEFVEEEDLDAFLFHLSSCEKTSAEHWGRLYSFMIGEEPVPRADADHAIQLTLQQMKEFATAESGAQRAEDVFKFMFAYIYEQQKAESHKYDEIAQRFVEGWLNIAYNNAFEMRNSIISKEADINEAKAQIRDAFEKMQIMNQMPLNRLIQRNDSKNKRKMALATYFFLAPNPD